MILGEAALGAASAAEATRRLLMLGFACCFMVQGSGLLTIHFSVGRWTDAQRGLQINQGFIRDIRVDGKSDK